MNNDSQFGIKVQYYCDGTPPDVPCREENFKRRHLQFELPLQSCALVVVDPWDRHHIESWLERAGRVMSEFVVPTMTAARAAGMMIVIAPSPEVIHNHARWREQVYPKGVAEPPISAREPDWPPPDFRRREGQYHGFRNPRSQPPGIDTFWKGTAEQLDISPVIDVQDTDVLVATGDQLHAQLRERNILHLFYCGFATNWCVLGRDYGVAAMTGRGYNPIILREATEGVEFPDTLSQRWATEIAIREVEQRHGFSAATSDFIAACDGLR